MIIFPDFLPAISLVPLASGNFASKERRFVRFHELLRGKAWGYNFRNINASTLVRFPTLDLIFMQKLSRLECRQ